MLFLCCGVFDKRIQARLLAGSGVFLENLLLSRFVESFDGSFEPFLCIIDMICSDSLTRFFYSITKYSLDTLILLGLAVSDAHVFFGGFFDRHKCGVFSNNYKDVLSLEHDREHRLNKRLSSLYHKQARLASFCGMMETE